MLPALAVVAALLAVPVVTTTAVVVMDEKGDKALCAYMEGTYNPNGPDLCPGAKWSKIYTYVAQKHDVVPEPK